MKKQKTEVETATIDPDEIKLNVGGTIFKTTRSLLSKWPNSYFGIISSGRWQPDKDGNVIFHEVVCFLILVV